MNIRTGEKPGVGHYICVSCGKTLILDGYDDRMPPCPGCYGTTFERIG